MFRDDRVTFDRKQDSNLVFERKRISFALYRKL